MWNSITNPNGNRNSDGYRDGHTDCNRNADCDCDGHTDRNSNSYVHAKTHSNPEAPQHTKATSDSTASSVTGNTRLEKSNQESRNRRKGISEIEGKVARVATSESGSRASFNRGKEFPR